jgi:hypothetical protein
MASALWSSPRAVDGDDLARAHQRRLDEMGHAERPDPHHGDAVAGQEPARSPDGRGAFEAVGDGEDLGEHRDVRRELLGHAEHRCARPEVEVLGPAAEQVRRFGAAERVAVVLQVAAQEVGEAAQARAAGAAGAVGRGHHAIARLQQTAVVGAGSTGADGLDDPDVLVTLDDRERGAALHRGSGVLHGLAAERVLVGAADAGGDHAQEHCARLQIRGHRVGPDLDPAGSYQGGGLDGGHGVSSARGRRWRGSGVVNTDRPEKQCRVSPRRIVGATPENSRSSYHACSGELAGRSRRQEALVASWRRPAAPRPHRGVLRVGARLELGITGRENGPSLLIRPWPTGSSRRRLSTPRSPWSQGLHRPCTQTAQRKGRDSRPGPSSVH